MTIRFAMLAAVLLCIACQQQSQRGNMVVVTAPEQVTAPAETRSTAIAPAEPGAGADDRAEAEPAPDEPEIAASATAESAEARSEPNGNDEREAAAETVAGDPADTEPAEVEATSPERVEVETVQPDADDDLRPVETAPAEVEPVQPRPEAPEVDNGAVRTVAIRNDPDAPLNESALDSVRLAFENADCTLVESLEADLLVLCSAPERQWTVGRAPEQMVYLVETRMPAGDATLRLPPDWAPRAPASRWQALIEFELVEWQTRGESTWTMPVVTINLGRQGIDHPEFDRADLEQLQSLAEQWATQKPWLGRSRR
jgi:hypothetical protein